MKIFKAILIGIMLFVLGWNAQAQEAKPVFMERADSNLVRFYYDKNYFLVDKNCEFHSIERIAEFNAKTSFFIGEFKDYSLDGKLLLEGNYRQGIKEGVFKAYHPNGQLKWQMTYQQGVPVGELNFFYPDGNLLMTVLHQGETVKLMTLMDDRGRRLVMDGNGKYNFKVPYAGYNPYGFPFVRLRGNIRDGFAVGKWQVLFEDDKGTVEAGEEYYAPNGAFREGYDYYTQEVYDAARYPLWPIEPFMRGEHFVSKDCTFDDFTGYTMYLGKAISDYFEGAEIPDLSKYEITYTVEVDKRGIPKKAKVATKFNPDFDRIFASALGEIGNYIPSFVNGEYVDDELTVNLIAQKAGDGSLLFHSVKINRKAENP